MSTRDQELDWLQKELQSPGPHIEAPETLTDDTGAVCWIAQERFCGPDCVAYDPEDDDGHCLALRTGIGLLRALEVVVSASGLNKAKRASQDPLEAARQQPPPKTRVT